MAKAVKPFRQNNKWLIFRLLEALGDKSPGRTLKFMQGESDGRFSGNGHFSHLRQACAFHLRESKLYTLAEIAYVLGFASHTSSREAISHYEAKLNGSQNGFRRLDESELRNVFEKSDVRDIELRSLDTIMSMGFETNPAEILIYLRSRDPRETRYKKTLRAEFAYNLLNHDSGKVSSAEAAECAGYEDLDSMQQAIDKNFSRFRFDSSKA